jgi:DNA-binding protein H-NS
MSTLKELVAQKEALERRIAEVKQTQISEAISKVQAIVAEFDLTVEDVFPKGKSRAKGAAKSKGVPKFRDPISGKTWTGHGTAPKWLDGKDRSQFAIS